MIRSNGIQLLFSCLLAMGLAPSATKAAADPLRDAPITYLSPEAGARGILPRSNVIVRFRSATDLETGAVPPVTVTGSVSGLHTGSLVISSDGQTLGFNPTHEFAWGERVTVVVSRPPTDMGGGPSPLASFWFDIAPGPPPHVASPIAMELSEAQALRRNGAAAEGGALEQLTQSGPPPLSSTIYQVPTPGALFLSNFTGLMAPGFLMIVNDFGVPYFYRSQPTSCLDFKLQPNGMLTYYDYGLSKFYVMDSTYTIVDSIAAQNGYYADGHELRLLPNGHSLLLIYDAQVVDMSIIVPGGNPAATVVGAVIQELDEQKNVVFQWRSWDHFQITDATHENLTAAFIDYVHANALDLDTDGNILMSSRHLDEITKISRTTGDVIWRWGGKNNQFAFIGDPDAFSHQHGIRRLANGHMILYDNGNFHTPHFSRASEYAVDETGKTATLAWQYRSTPDVYGPAMGFAQRLDNGSTLVSWGLLSSPAFSEIAADGSKVMQMSLPAGNYTYRAFRQSWLSDTTSVLDAPRGAILLSPMSPNPTRGRTSLVVNLTRESNLSVRLYDLNGRLVRDVAEESRRTPGLYRVNLDLTGSPAGVYFLKLAAGREVMMRKVVRLR